MSLFGLNLRRAVNPAPSTLWYGVSGTSYEFEHFEIGQVSFNRIGGVYIFCREVQDGSWRAAYIGETVNFRRCLEDGFARHPWRDHIAAAGATHICTMVVRNDDAERRRVKNDLRHLHSPSRNHQQLVNLLSRTWTSPE